MRLTALTYLICVLCLSSVYTRSPARAQPSTKTAQRAQFKALVDEAVRAYKEERFEDAIKFFEAALKLQPEYRLHWNLAVLYERTGRLEVALGHVDQFLKDPSLSQASRSKAEARRAQIIERVERARPVRMAVLPASTPSAPPPAEQTTARPVTPQVIEVERIRPTPAQQRGLPTWSYWAIGGGLSGLTSLGLHLYADSIWADLPKGISQAQEAQSQAWTYSWVGDFFLVGSVASLSIAVWKWSDGPAPRSSTALGTRSGVSRALYDSELTFIGQGLIWRGRF